MRSILALIALAAVTVGCAAPRPTTLPASLVPGGATAPPTSGSTPASSPGLTASAPTSAMAAFEAPFPVAGWVMASAVDGTGAVERLIVAGAVDAGAVVDVAYACEQDTTISITLSDARSQPVVTLFAFETPCALGEIGRAVGPPISETMPVNLDVGVDPAVRFWAKLGVPADDLVR